MLTTNSKVISNLYKYLESIFNKDHKVKLERNQNKYYFKQHTQKLPWPSKKWTLVLVLYL